MTRPGIEPRSSRLLMNTLLIRPMVLFWAAIRRDLVSLQRFFFFFFVAMPKFFYEIPRNLSREIFIQLFFFAFVS